MEDEIRLSWAVCYDIDGKNYDDGKTRTVISGLFPYCFLAEDYIMRCLPKENEKRYYIKHVDSVKVAG